MVVPEGTVGRISDTDATMETEILIRDVREEAAVPDETGRDVPKGTNHR